MAKVVNLRTARKQAFRDAARREAAASSARSGEGKASRTGRMAETAREATRLDGHRRERPDGDG